MSSLPSSTTLSSSCLHFGQESFSTSSPQKEKRGRDLGEYVERYPRSDSADFEGLKATDAVLCVAEQEGYAVTFR